VDFTWRDGERLVRFAAGAAAEAAGLADEAGLEGWTLLTTPRAAPAAPALAAGVRRVLEVPPGRVDEVSAALLGSVGGEPLVALGGGRVIDTAKALAGATGTRCGALPTTLSGAEMTPFHRTPLGATGARLVRPALVVADPELMASAPAARLAATAMNALAHALEALYTPYANPVAELSALRAAGLIAAGLPAEPPDRSALALAAVLAGHASGSAGIAVHHAVCQSIVRAAGGPHAETNAVMLPHSARLMAPRAPAALGRFAAALGAPDGEPGAAAAAIAPLAARCGHTDLRSLGVREEHVKPAAAAAAAHPATAATPSPPDAAEIEALVRAAL
jgi:alcohol dehydrogenase class IV